MAEKLRHNDHRVIGPKLNLYQQAEIIGSGLPLLPWQGEVVINELQTFLRDLLNKNCENVSHQFSKSVGTSL